MVEVQIQMTSLYSRVGIDLVLHPLQLGHGGQQGEVRDGEVGGGHVGGLLQEHVQVVQALLQGVGLPLVSLLPGHELRMLKISSCLSTDGQIYILSYKVVHDVFVESAVIEEKQSVN